MSDWPTDGIYVGERSLEMGEALAHLERTPQTAEEALVSALIVAELNLASGGDDRLLPLVYEGHALLSDGALEDEDALALADALSADRICP